VEAAWGRIRQAAPMPHTGLAVTPSKREAPRVPFGTLVEQGLVSPGTTLFDRHRKVAATVGADGTLAAGSHHGSIHQVGAAVQNAPSCNGWTFWHVERDGALVPIDTLRTAARLDAAVAE